MEGGENGSGIAEISERGSRCRSMSLGVSRERTYSATSRASGEMSRMTSERRDCEHRGVDPSLRCCETQVSAVPVSVSQYSHLHNGHARILDLKGPFIQTLQI